MGKVCLVGCVDLVIDEPARQARLGETVIREGEPLCLDGDTGTIHADSPEITIERPESLIKQVTEWRARVMIKQVNS
jgi:pyruvate,orthophosphate dikinase